MIIVHILKKMIIVHMTGWQTNFKFL